MKRIIIPILILVFSISLLYADTDKEIGKKFKLRVQTDNKKNVTWSENLFRLQIN